MNEWKCQKQRSPFGKVHFSNKQKKKKNNKALFKSQISLLGLQETLENTTSWSPHKDPKFEAYWTKKKWASSSKTTKGRSESPYGVAGPASRSAVRGTGNRANVPTWPPKEKTLGINRPSFGSAGMAWRAKKVQKGKRSEYRLAGAASIRAQRKKC